MRAVPERRMFVGHHHTWRLVDEAGPSDWAGESPFRFDSGRRSLMTVHALSDGHFAVMDTDADVLTPFAAGGGL